jgi:hypothetical protein
METQRRTDLIAAGNTYNPSLIVLRDKGYILSAEALDEDRLLWNAEKDGHKCKGYSPPELLGIVVLWESLGEGWNQQMPDILGELFDRTEGNPVGDD